MEYVTGDLDWGRWGVEMVTKMVLYYFHERAWFRYGKLGGEKKSMSDYNKSPR